MAIVTSSFIPRPLHWSLGMRLGWLAVTMYTMRSNYIQQSGLWLQGCNYCVACPPSVCGLHCQRPGCLLCSKLSFKLREDATSMTSLVWEGGKNSSVPMQNLEYKESSQSD